MYSKILLASDGTRETLVALREGALIAQGFKASAHLLIIDATTPSVRMAEGLGGYPLPAQGQDLLEIGLDRLRRLGVPASGELLRGEAAQLVTACVRRLSIDLVVLGHKRQSFLDRWWSGASGAYIVDGVRCSVLIARDTVTDEEFDSHLARCDLGREGDAPAHKSQPPPYRLPRRR